jgi:hypothetical protein
MALHRSRRFRTIHCIGGSWSWSLQIQYGRPRQLGTVVVFGHESGQELLTDAALTAREERHLVGLIGGRAVWLLPVLNEGSAPPTHHSVDCFYFLLVYSGFQVCKKYRFASAFLTDTKYQHACIHSVRAIW